jgi:hypothetical protein
LECEIADTFSLPLLSQGIRLYLLESSARVRRFIHFPGSRWDTFHALTITSLGTVCGLSIVAFLRFLPLGRAINPVPPTAFTVGVVRKTLGTSRISEMSRVFIETRQALSARNSQYAITKNSRLGDWPD